MRTRMVAASVLMLALGAAGCGRGTATDPSVASAQQGGAKPTASASAAASADPDAELKFARCMREQGLTWFPDPNAGRMSVTIPKGTDPAKMEAAQKACKQFLPDGGNPPKPSAEDLENARKMAQCMRDNGIPTFPDPNPDGGMTIDPKKLGFDPEGATFKKADEICSAKYGGNGPKHVQRNDSGPGGSVVNGGQTA